MPLVSGASAVSRQTCKAGDANILKGSSRPPQTNPTPHVHPSQRDSRQYVSAALFHGLRFSGPYDNTVSPRTTRPQPPRGKGPRRRSRLQGARHDLQWCSRSGGRRRCSSACRRASRREVSEHGNYPPQCAIELLGRQSLAARCGESSGLNTFEWAVEGPSNRVTEPHDTFRGWRVLLRIAGRNVVDQIALPFAHLRTDAPPPGAQRFETPGRLIEQVPCVQVESGRDLENVRDLAEHLLAEAARA